MRKIEKREITHRNTTIKTKNYLTESEFSHQDCEDFRAEIRTKPDFKKVLSNFKSIQKNNFMFSNIANYYVQNAMWNTLNKNYKWTVNEYLESDDLVRMTIATINAYPKTFNQKKSHAYNFLAGVRRSFIFVSTAVPVSTVPIRKIIKKYMPKTSKNHLGFAAGWGTEVLASLSEDMNYYGIEPNPLSRPGLQQMGEDFINFRNSENQIVDIKMQGSEKFIPEWENKMGLAYSIPPQPSEQSYKLGGDQSDRNETYKQWLENYWRVTVKNIERYLTEDGIFLLSTKKTNVHDYVSDMSKILGEEGFQFIESGNYLTDLPIDEANQRSVKCLDIYAFRRK